MTPGTHAHSLYLLYKPMKNFYVWNYDMLLVLLKTIYSTLLTLYSKRIAKGWIFSESKQHHHKGIVY